MWTRHWLGRTPLHPTRLVESEPLDSEPKAGLARVAASALRTDSPARQRQIERILLNSASAQSSGDFYSIRLRNTTLDQPVSDTSSIWHAAEKLFWHTRI
jgi:hypothetical protein